MVPERIGSGLGIWIWHVRERRHGNDGSGPEEVGFLDCRIAVRETRRTTPLKALFFWNSKVLEMGGLRAKKRRLPKGCAAFFMVGSFNNAARLSPCIARVVGIRDATRGHWLADATRKERGRPAREALARPRQDAGAPVAVWARRGALSETIVRR